MAAALEDTKSLHFYLVCHMPAIRVFWYTICHELNFNDTEPIARSYPMSTATVSTAQTTNLASPLPALRANLARLAAALDKALAGSADGARGL
jgi:hypothetical protein